MTRTRSAPISGSVGVAEFPSFTKLYNYIDAHPSLNSTAKRVWACVLNYARSTGKCWASQSRIARDLDLDRSWVCRSLDALVRVGVLIKIPRPGRTCVYLVPERPSDKRKDRFSPPSASSPRAAAPSIGVPRRDFAPDANERAAAPIGEDTQNDRREIPTAPALEDMPDEADECAGVSALENFPADFQETFPAAEKFPASDRDGHADSLSETSAGAVDFPTPPPMTAGSTAAQKAHPPMRKSTPLKEERDLGSLRVPIIKEDDCKLSDLKKVRAKKPGANPALERLRELALKIIALRNRLAKLGAATPIFNPGGYLRVLIGRGTALLERDLAGNQARLLAFEAEREKASAATNVGAAHSEKPPHETAWDALPDAERADWQAFGRADADAEGLLACAIESYGADSPHVTALIAGRAQALHRQALDDPDRAATVYANAHDWWTHTRGPLDPLTCAVAACVDRIRARNAVRLV